MTFVSRPVAKDVKTIRQGDVDFILNDGMIQYPRAMLHITPECPQEIKSKIMWAVNNGYLKCVAHAYGKEVTMDALR